MRRKPRFIEKKDTGPKVLINDFIRAPQLRVVVDGGDALGVLTREAALKEARERGLDLVEIAPQAEPPVAKIMDFGKFAFQQKKKTQESKRKQKQIQVKEVKFRPRIDEHDYDFKKKNILRFLEDGDKVKATIQFRGREMTRLDMGKKVIERLQQDLAGFGVLESDPSMLGNRMHAIFGADHHRKVTKPKADSPSAPAAKPAPEASAAKATPESDAEKS